MSDPAAALVSALARRPPSRSAKLAVVCCSLLVLLLPTVVVGLSVGQPASQGELVRVERVIEQRHHKGRIDTSGSRLFHTAAIPDAAWPPDQASQQALILRARLMQVLGIAAIVFLTYFAVMLARGRLQALLACALMAGLPPVLQSGYILRAETPATLFALLSVLLFEVASQPAPRHRSRRPLQSSLFGFGLMFCAASAAAMACETLPSLGTTLLVPGVVLMIGAVQLWPRGFRCLRRRGLNGLPIRSLNRRLTPWTATVLVAAAIALWLQNSSWAVSVESLARTEPTSPLMPSNPLAYGAVVGLLVVGLIASILRVGLQLGRGWRIEPGLILFVYCAVFLMQAWVRERDYDPLPVVPALAILLSEGLRAVMVVLLGVSRRSASRSI